ncbi:hypothetical protein Tco_1422502 [Tanacetum coccineum]
MDRYPNAYLEELEAFMTQWDVKPRVEESSLETLSVDELITQLRQMCEDAEDHASNAQEEAQQKRKEALEEMLNQLIATRVAEALTAVAVTHAAITQEETNLGSNSSQNKTCNYKEFRAVMHESFCGTEGVNVYVRSVTLDTAHATPWSDFKAMFIWKYCPRNEIKQMENQLWNLKTQALLLVTTIERQDIRPKTAELHLVPQPREDPEAKEDREAMSLVLDVVRKDTTRTSVQTM